MLACVHEVRVHRKITKQAQQNHTRYQVLTYRYPTYLVRNQTRTTRTRTWYVLDILSQTTWHLVPVCIICTSTLNTNCCTYRIWPKMLTPSSEIPPHPPQETTPPPPVIKQAKQVKCIAGVRYITPVAVRRPSHQYQRTCIYICCVAAWHMDSSTEEGQSPAARAAHHRGQEGVCCAGTTFCPDAAC